MGYGGGGGGGGGSGGSGGGGGAAGYGSGGSGAGGSSGYRRVGDDRTANLKVDNITNRDGSSGTEVDGIVEVNTTAHFIPPSGTTAERGSVVEIDLAHEQCHGSEAHPYAWQVWNRWWLLDHLHQL